MSDAGIPRAGLLQLAGSVILLSSAWPVAKRAINLGAAPLWFATGRAGFSALAAFALLAALRRLRLPARADVPALLAVGVLQLAAFFAFAHAAVALVPAGRTAILSNVTTIWIMPLSLLVLHESISARRWIATGFGLAGTMVLMSPWAIDWSAPGVLLGHFFLLGAALAFALTIIVVRRLPPRLTMLQLLPWCFGLATLLLAAVASVHGGGIGRWPAGAVASVAYIGLLAGPIGTWCVMQVSLTLPAMVASVGFLATPAAGLLLSTLWLGEPLTLDLVTGSMLILGGVAIAAWPARR